MVWSLNEMVKQSLIEAVERRRNNPSSGAPGQDHRAGSRTARTPRSVNVEYPDLTDYPAVAAEVTGTDLKTIANATKLDLADSALHTWTAYPSIDEGEQAVLSVAAFERDG